MTEDEYIEDYGDEPHYRTFEEINFSDIRNALRKLHLLGGDLYLQMQAFNLAIVDQFLTELEYKVLQKLIDEERTPTLEATFLFAQSQMWIFAAYEIMRTWRQRAKDMIKWSESGGLEAKLKALEKDADDHHVGRHIRAGQIKRVLADPSVNDLIRDDLRSTHILFAQMETIRISLAKHEVRGQNKSVASSPGYGRINQLCGSLDYEFESGAYSLGYISRRDIADGIRSLLTSDATPTDEEIEQFEAFMRGPAWPTAG